MKAIAVSLFLLAVLMVLAGVVAVNSGTSGAWRLGAFVPAAIVIFMFLRVARECRAIERQEHERALEE